MLQRAVVGSGLFSNTTVAWYFSEAQKKKLKLFGSYNKKWLMDPKKVKTVREKLPRLGPLSQKNLSVLRVSKTNCHITIPYEINGPQNRFKRKNIKDTEEKLKFRDHFLGLIEACFLPWATLLANCFRVCFGVYGHRRQIAEKSF